MVLIPNNIILTGMPRSGSMLAGALIDSLPGAVCLNTPAWQMDQALEQRGGHIRLSKWLVGDFFWQRARLHYGQPIPDTRAPDGSALLDGTLDTQHPTQLLRLMPDGFTLAMRHDGLYSCLLPALADFSLFTIIAVIRNPRDVIASWQRMEGQPIARAKLPPAAHYWPDAAAASASGEDTLTHMVQLYETILERYHALSAHIHIVKYEDMIQDPALISRLLGQTVTPPAAIHIRTPSQPLATPATEALRAKIHTLGTVIKLYYPE